MNRRWLIAALLAGLLAVCGLSGCGEDDPAAGTETAGQPALPDRVMNYEGPIREIDSERLVLPGDSGCDVQVTNLRPIVLKQVGPEEYVTAAWEDLSAGTNVKVWTGDVFSSCPARTSAETIVIVEP